MNLSRLFRNLPNDVTNALMVNVRPSENFERKNGLKGISRNWLLPDSLSPAQLQRDIHEYEARLVSQGIDLRGENDPSQYRWYRPGNLMTYAQKYFNNRLEGERAYEHYASLLEEIIALNPELQDVQYDPEDVNEIVPFLIGITSGYNAADINFYLNSTPEERHGVLKALQEEGLKTGWLPAPDTVDLIKIRMGTRATTLDADSV